jgi:hypothetical protein
VLGRRRRNSHYPNSSDLAGVTTHSDDLLMLERIDTGSRDDTETVAVLLTLTSVIFDDGIVRTPDGSNRD